MNDKIQGQKEHEESHLSHVDRYKFLYLFIILEGIIIIFYSQFVAFGEEAAMNNAHDKDIETKSKDTVKKIYTFFQDVHVMVFVGFGFLMAYLKQHCWMSLGMNFLMGIFAIQWGILCLGFWTNAIHGHWKMIEIDAHWLIRADFLAATILVSYGGVLGKFNMGQYLIMTFLECIFVAMNSILCEEYLKGIDMGGSMYIHTFGAYFGLAVCMATKRKDAFDNNNNGASYASTITAFIGTIFLFMFWPSFNVALVSGTAQQRGMINTYSSIIASTLAVFIVSPYYLEGKLKMENILNATLAGGVILGASSDLISSTYPPIIIGFIGGIVSLVGFMTVHPFLNRVIELQDTAGIHNLHGMPGFFGGIIGAIVIASYGDDNFSEKVSNYYNADESRTCTDQAKIQACCLFITTGVAIMSGFVTGLILNTNCINKPNEIFKDDIYWELGFYDSDVVDAPKLEKQTDNNPWRKKTKVFDAATIERLRKLDEAERKQIEDEDQEQKNNESKDMFEDEDQPEINQSNSKDKKKEKKVSSGDNQNTSYKSVPKENNDLKLYPTNVKLDVISDNLGTDDKDDRLVTEARELNSSKNNWG